MTDKDPEVTRATAEQRLRKREESEAAALNVRAEIEAKKVATQANTARLRALRLEKEASDQVRAAEVQAMGKAGARKRDPHASTTGPTGKRGNKPR